MKQLTPKEARELEKTEKLAALKAANKDAARDLILQMMASLPRKPLSSQNSLAYVKEVLHRSMELNGLAPRKITSE